MIDSVQISPFESGNKAVLCVPPSSSSELLNLRLGQFGTTHFGPFLQRKKNDSLDVEIEAHAYRVCCNQVLNVI